LLLSARAPAAAIDRYLLQARALSSKPAAHAAAAVDRRDRQTDGHSTVPGPCFAHYAGSGNDDDDDFIGMAANRLD